MSVPANQHPVAAELHSIVTPATPAHLRTDFQQGVRPPSSGSDYAGKTQLTANQMSAATSRVRTDSLTIASRLTLACLYIGLPLAIAQPIWASEAARLNDTSIVNAITRATDLSDTTVARVHPQDGPHAELRMAVTDDGLRLGIGLNLAYMDEVVPMQREMLGAVVGPEQDTLQQAALDHLTSQIIVEINGKRVQPTVEHAALFADPDAGMAALYPNYGTRALIRLVTTLQYPAASPESLSVTWPRYPKDALSASMEGLSPEEAPAVFLEAQFRAQGALRMIRLSEAEPTFRWTAVEAASPLASLPEPPAALPPEQINLLRVIGAGVALLGIGGLLASFLKARSPAPTEVTQATQSVQGSRRRVRTLPVSLALGGMTAFVVGSVVNHPALLIEKPGSRTAPPSLSSEQAASVFTALHEHLYRAFDYTAEGDIYDALEQAVSGPLLEETYSELYAMLLQADQEGMVGVVTGIEPLQTSITNDSDNAPAFDVHHRWRVDGTVYHWGHTHTRTHEYEAKFHVEPVDAGWRITGRNILSQERLESSTTAPGPGPTQATPTARPLGEL